MATKRPQSIDGLAPQSRRPQPTTKPVTAKKKSVPPAQRSTTGATQVSAKPSLTNPAVPTNASTTPLSKSSNSPLQGWSWGGFLLSWVWAIGNRTWIGLLALIPIAPISLIVAIYLGLKGNELAWQARTWESPEVFIQTQRNWAKAGFVVVLVVIGLALLAFLVLGLQSATA